MKHVEKWMAVIGWALLQVPAQAVDIEKANNTTALDSTGSWLGGSAPDSTNVAVWGSALTTDRTASLNGASLSWAGIRSTSSFNHTISGSGALTLGASGIDLSSAGGNFSFAFPAGSIVIGADQTWNIAAGRTLSFSNFSSSGSGKVTLNGSGAVSFSGAVFGTGALNIDGNIKLRPTSVAIGNALNANSDFSIYTTNGAGTFTLNGGMNIGSGTGTRTITVGYADGAGTMGLIFGTASTEISGNGTLAFAYDVASTRSSVGVRIENKVNVAAIHVGSNVNLYFNTSDRLSTAAPVAATVDGQFYLSNGSGASASQTVKSLSGGGTVRTTAGATLTIDGGTGTGSTTFSGNVIDGTNTVSVTKTGSTLQVFAGTNTYTGTTTINAGTLLINGTHVQAATGNGYAVNNGGTLGGTGLIRRNSAGNTAVMVAVASGGSVAPGGNGVIGSFTLDGQSLTGTTAKHLTMAANSTFSFDLAGNGSGADTLDFWSYASGELTLNNNAVNFSLQGPKAIGSYTVDLFRFYNDSGTTLTISGITNGLTLGTLGEGIGTASFDYTTTPGLIRLNYTVTVPEPSTWALAGAGLAALLWRRRRARGTSIS